MRVLIAVPVLISLGLGLSGCAVAEVGGAVIGGASSAVGTAVDVAGDVISAPIDAVSGGGDKKPKD